MKFDGSSGRKPSAEARRYLYAVMSNAVLAELRDPDGWVFGGVEDEVDKRRLREEVKRLSAELMRRAQRP